MTRLERFLAQPLFSQFDAALILRREDMRYLSGYTGEGALLISREDKLLITDFRYIVQAKVQAPGWTVTESQRGNTLDTVIALAREKGYASLGVEESHLTYAGFQQLSKGIGAVRFEDIGNTVEKLRAIKEPQELRAIAKAAQVADMGLRKILDFVKPGMTEKEVQIELAYQCGKLGSQGFGFEFIVASGPNGAMPHAVAGGRKIQPGDLVTIDMGCLVDGYNSDMTRTFAIGNVSDELKKIYDTVLKAQLAALEALGPGKNGKDVDAVARGIIAEAGYGDYFGHALGHGVGLMVHELPRLSPLIDMQLEPGMAVTVEPGIYVPDLGGVRIEDLCIVTQEGYLNLCSTTKELIVL